jgi:hypothetical protein
MLVGRLFAGSPVTSRPSIFTTPEDGSSNPAMVRRSVVFPQPDGPRSEKNSPCRISRLMPRSAW